MSLVCALGIGMAQYTESLQEQQCHFRLCPRSDSTEKHFRSRNVDLISGGLGSVKSQSQRHY